MLSLGVVVDRHLIDDLARIILKPSNLSVSCLGLTRQTLSTLDALVSVGSYSGVESVG